MLDHDYINQLSILIRQTPAICISLVFDSNGLPDFKGPKYAFPSSPSPILTGFNSYPFMVSIPHVSMSPFHALMCVSVPFMCLHSMHIHITYYVSSLQGFDHRANIISTIMSRSVPLSSSPQFITQHDDVCAIYIH